MNLSRRGFLQRALAALMVGGCSSSAKKTGTGGWLPGWFARELVEARERGAGPATKSVPANSRIGFGVIGTGTRGSFLMHSARGQPGVEVVAVCDVDSNRRDKAAADLGPGCARYGDFRELLARKDIDAVAVAAPDHWHALLAMAALRAGKDVYCEKPMTLTIAEGQALVAAVRATGRVLQVGSQQRIEYPQFRLACELIRNGRLGTLKAIQVQLGPNLKGGPFPVMPPPAGLDWDFWLGPAPETDYVRERCHGNFRWWYEYSGGRMTDWGAHHNDIAQWALDMDKSGPVRIEATGEEPSGLANCYNCHPRFHVTYTYENGVLLHCTSEEENGIRFEGEDGRWLFASRDIRRCSASDGRLVDEPLSGNALRLEVPASEHMEDFVACVRSRKQPVCSAEIGHRSATVCHLGVIALRTGKSLQWDPVREVLAGDVDAGRWLAREMRGPWKL
jgi:predicted dehydrogenase